jgi:DNA adenine methylase
MLYVEPFVGSAAMLLEMQPRVAVINDINKELIETYEIIKTDPRELIEKLAMYDKSDSEQYYYLVRDMFNDIKDRVGYDRVDQSASFIYLNARCFNGLYRENSEGKMNAPYAKDLKGMKKVCNSANMWRMSDYLKGADVTITNLSYQDVIPIVEDKSKGGAVFFFLDPPYYPLSETASFTSYVGGSWNDADFVELKRFVDKVDDNGWLFLLCNHAVPFITGLFSGYYQVVHSVSRSVSCKARERKPVDEILVANYDITKMSRKVETL